MISSIKFNFILKDKGDIQEYGNYKKPNLTLQINRKKEKKS